MNEPNTEMPSSPAPTGAWQPIRNALKKKAVLLWWSGCKNPAVGRWEYDGITEGWRCDGDQCVPKNQHNCTHWMPLPEPPNDQAHPQPGAAAASLSSPALKHQSEIYPPRYRGRVPWKIKMACTVRPDLEWLCKTRGTVAVMDEVYECWVNMHGAVAAICRNGEKLGIKPAEFDVEEWHTQTPNDPDQRPGELPKS